MDRRRLSQENSGRHRWHLKLDEDTARAPLARISRPEPSPNRTRDRGGILTQSSSVSQNPWNTFGALMIGVIMVGVDSTIVTIASPTIRAQLDMGYDTVIGVTSAYLLGYAVLMLIAGRLGDRFGSKNLYLIGLVVFTGASLWCGLSGSAAALIAARFIQGVGAGVLTPQTSATISRILPEQRRGIAMTARGAIAGGAALVGLVAGGKLVEGPGWQWIFLINIPIGVLGMALAVRLVPALPTRQCRMDPIGFALSGIGLFLLVFGLQHGQAARWQPWIWAVVVAGVGFVTVFGYWESANTREPLIPVEIFRDRDFRLCALGAAIISFASTTVVLPLTFYAQEVWGLSPAQSAFLIAPMAIANAVLAPLVGRIVGRYHPRVVLGFAFSVLAIALTMLSFDISPDTSIWRMVLPFAAAGAGMAFGWRALTATATRGMTPSVANSSSVVYESVCQFGAVLGSAGIAAFMTWRIATETPQHAPDWDDAAVLQLPKVMLNPFSAAMSQSVQLPAFVALFGIVAALFFAEFAGSARWRESVGPEATDVVDTDDDDAYVELVLVRPVRLGTPRSGRDRQSVTGYPTAASACQTNT